MTIEKIFEELEKWQAENKDNRAVILIATTKISENEEEAEYQSTAALVGNGKVAVAGVESALEQAESIRSVIKRAVSENALKNLINSFENRED